MQRNLLWADAQRAFDALIGEVEAAGDAQKKTGWMSQAWHRRLTWVRWLKELRAYCEDQHTMALARIAALGAPPPAAPSPTDPKACLRELVRIGRHTPSDLPFNQYDQWTEARQIEVLARFVAGLPFAPPEGWEPAIGPQGTTTEWRNGEERPISHRAFAEPIPTAAAPSRSTPAPQTTLVESEWQIALRWRDKFLNEDNEQLPPLDAQIVAYLIADAEELRRVAAAFPAVEATPPCGAVGEPEAGRKVCELLRGHEGCHQQGGTRWLGYHPAAVDAPPTIEAAFKAGYHCRWHRDTLCYTFDPALAPGDPDGAFAAWRAAAVSPGAAEAVPREPPQVTAEHGLYWLYRLQDAFAAIEAQGICRVDLDCLAESEDATLRRFLGVLQDFAHGYSEYDKEQPRLSALFMQVLHAESGVQ